MGPTSSSATSITNNYGVDKKVNNIQNHQTDFESHVTNKDYLKEVGGDRIGGSANTFNGIQNAGYQCFGATCLQELFHLPILPLQQLHITGAGSYYNPSWMVAGAPQPLGTKSMGTWDRVAYTQAQIDEAKKMLTAKAYGESASLADFEM